MQVGKRSGTTEDGGTVCIKEVDFGSTTIVCIRLKVGFLGKGRWEQLSLGLMHRLAR